MLAAEQHYVRVNLDATVLDSYVPLSALRGGATRFRRSELVAALTKEDAVLVAYLRCNALDRELHDIVASPKE